MAILAYLAVIAALFVWEPGPDDGAWVTIVLFGPTLLVGAVIAKWWALSLAFLATALGVALNHATGCTGSHGCEDVLAVFFLLLVAGVLLIGVAVGKLARRFARR
ncbi:MAG: hypothetical protein ACR2NH_07015 [Solirubrobacteraceae bacterium]